MKIQWKYLLLSLIMVYLIAFLGSLFTSGNTSSAWYDSIRPEITPPNFIFPIVWNILFFLIGISLYLVIVSQKTKFKKKAYIFFSANLILNVLWSVFYFGLKNLELAFVEIIFLGISIIGMIYYSYKIDKKAAWLLFPYLLWVGFAAVLNWLSL
jgi:translocator protein